MKKEKLAFTLIELLISVSIVSIISVSSINWFFNFLQQREANMKMMEFSYYLDSLDKEVKNHEIFDYQLEINLQDSNDSYIVYTDIFDTAKQQTLSFSWETTEINITWKDDSETIQTKIYQDDKFIKNSSTETLSEEFDKDYNYIITTSLFDASNNNYKTILNNILLKRFDRSEHEMYLTKVSETEDWANINNLTIKNIWWKKYFYNNWSTLTWAYLYFENKWAESFLKLTK